MPPIVLQRKEIWTQVLVLLKTEVVVYTKAKIIGDGIAVGFHVITRILNREREEPHILLALAGGQTATRCSSRREYKNRPRGTRDHRGVGAEDDQPKDLKGGAAGASKSTTKPGRSVPDYQVLLPHREDGATEGAPADHSIHRYQRWH